ncbi:MAG TPA: hypothetical protein VMX55_13855 [candidate division Zixibacteria bacterium]|nr:hypothetical protein [candidate division Zixibacteria bacterium]
MTETNKDEKSIAFLLTELINLSSEVIQNGKFTLLTNQLWEEDEYVIYSIIKFLVKKYRSTGILKVYKRKELLYYFKWEETQFDHYLKQAVKYNVLQQTNRKYALNLDHVLVKRVLNFYINTKHNENTNSSEMLEITSIIKKKLLLEIEKEKLELIIGNDDLLQNNSLFIDFIEEIRSVMESSGYDPKDPLLIVCEKKLARLINQ